MSQQGHSSHCHVTALLPHRIKKKVQNKRGKRKKYFKKQPFSILTLFHRHTAILEKEGEGREYFQGWQAHPQFLAAGRLSRLVVPQWDFNCTQGASGNMPWKHVLGDDSYLEEYKKDRRDKKQKKRWKVTCPKGESTFRAKAASWMCIRPMPCLLGNISVWLYCLLPPNPKVKTIQWQPTSARFWWVSGPRGRCRTAQRLWAMEQYMVHSAQGVTPTQPFLGRGAHRPTAKTYTAKYFTGLQVEMEREQWIHSKK